MDDILAKILARKVQRVAERKRVMPPPDVEKLARALPAPRFNLLEILKHPSPSGLHVIAEVKKASPSRGILRADFQPLEIARTYHRGGASAISVLTEEDFFLGSDEFLRAIAREVPLPALRKDFILEPYQIFEAKLFGASAYLLIAACLDESALRDLIVLGQEIGLTPLVEVHDETELEKALLAGTTLLGINNRNLRTFQTSLETTARLRKFVPSGIPVVSESGIFLRADMTRLASEGAQAVLVGESLMREPDIEAKLRELLGTAKS